MQAGRDGPLAPAALLSRSLAGAPPAPSSVTSRAMEQLGLVAAAAAMTTSGPALFILLNSFLLIHLSKRHALSGCKALASGLERCWRLYRSVHTAHRAGGLQPPHLSCIAAGDMLHGHRLRGHRHEMCLGAGPAPPQPGVGCGRSSTVARLSPSVSQGWFGCCQAQ